MFRKVIVPAIVTVLTLTQSINTWSLDNVQVTGRRSYPFDLESEQDVGLREDEEKPDGYPNWYEEQVELQRRADEELEAAEIAAAEEEYERIKYKMELEQEDILDEAESKRSPTEIGEGSEFQTRIGRFDEEAGDVIVEKSLAKKKKQKSASENTEKEVEGQKKSPKMGVSDLLCDDGKHKLAVDWDPDDPKNGKDYTCDSEFLQPAHHTFEVECIHPEKPKHHCMRDNLTKAMEPPVMGNHRPLWARYGKYKYLPWQRWLHNLEHGAVGLLYHKCADPAEVKEAENVLVNCMWKHIITPYELPPDKPMALVSWGCYLYMTHFDKNAVFSFIKNHSMHGRENRLATDGQYSELLEKEAKIVSTPNDANICPESRFPEMYRHTLPSAQNKGAQDADDEKGRKNELGKKTVDWGIKRMKEKQELQRQLNEAHRQMKQRRSKVSSGDMAVGKTGNIKEKSVKRRDVDWMEERGSSLEESNVVPELEREAEIARLEREEDRTDLEREEDIAQLEKEEDIARLEREEDIAQLEKEEDIAHLERDGEISRLERDDEVARLERDADVAHLEKDLETLKKLFREKVKPLLHK